MYILDGALGTELEKIKPIHQTKLWSGNVLIECPDLIQRIHEQYIRAGSNLITTCSYQMSYPALIEEGYSDTEVHQLWGKAVRTAKLACKGHEEVKIVGSIGPYGSYINDGSEYTGIYNVNESELKHHHSKMIEFMNNNDDIDIIGFETVPNVSELQAILSFNITKPYFISFRVNDNLTIEQITKIKPLPHLVAIGLNCVDYKRITTYLNELQHFSKTIPLLVYPNYGYKLLHTKFIADTDPNSWKSQVAKWLEFDLWGIGGCCSTTPKEIEIISSLVSNI